MQILEIITIGLPFCAFKCITGLYYGQYWLIALGLIDLVINLVNLFSVILKKKRIIHVCFFSFAVQNLKRPQNHLKPLWQDLGTSADVLLSFILVAMIIGTGAIGKLSTDQLMIWNISVIFNVIGAGSGRLTDSIKNITSNKNK